MNNIEPNCIFCKIVSGLEVSSKLYEDNEILAIMNINPVNSGEFLIIPKIHIDHFIDLPDKLAAHILIVAQKLSKNLMKKLKPLRVGYVVHGFGVSHAHLNIVPLYDSGDIVSKKQLKIENNKIIDDINLLPKPSRVELDRIANLIRTN